MDSPNSYADVNKLNKSDHKIFFQEGILLLLFHLNYVNVISV